VRAIILPASDARLVAEYLDDLARAGMQTDNGWRWGARAFCERYGDGAAWTGLPLEDQLALNPKIERFAAWLIATRRLRPSASTSSPDVRDWVHSLPGSTLFFSPPFRKRPPQSDSNPSPSSVSGQLWPWSALCMGFPQKI